MNSNNSLGLLPYGKQFQKTRRLFHQYFNPKACLAFHSIQTECARTLVSNLIANTGDHNSLLNRLVSSNISTVIYELYSVTFISSFSTAIIMRIAYGHRVVSDDDQFIRLTNERGYAVSNSGSPGSTPVDFFPFCK